MSWKTESRGGYPVLRIWPSTKDRWPLQGTLQISKNTNDIRQCSWNRNGRYEGDHMESEYDLIPIEPEPGKHADQHKDVGPIPKGFRLLGDEPRLASDCYWSYHDWILIGGRVEIANRDKWKAIRFVVDEPEPVKHFVVVTNQKGDQVFYVNGVLNRSSETSYDCFMAEVAKGRAVRIENYVAKKPVKEWPENLFDLVRKNNLVFEEREMIEPEPVKKFVLANDQDNEQALYVNGKLEDIDHPIYGYNIAEAANGCTIRIESREVGRPDPDDEWPTKLSELIIVDEEHREDPSGEWEATKDEVEYAMDRCGVPASVFGSDPIKDRPIMQIRLPVPASVLGKLGDMLEKHYPGSTMRQAGGYLVLDEPIES